MSFTKVTSAGIGSTELVTLDSLEVINNASIGGVLTYEDVTNVDSIGIITARAGVLVGSGITLSKDGDIFATGVTTATTFSGSGASLTNLPAANLTGTLPAISGANLTSLPAQVTIANNADNRVITGGSGVNLNGEANLTFDGTGNFTQTGSSAASIFKVQTTATSGDALIQASGEDGSGNTRMIQMRTDAGAGQYRIISSDTSYPLALCTGNGERLTITGIGSVGINKIDPTAVFQVNSTKNAETDRHDATNYHLALRNPADDNGEAIGLSFGITSNETKVGAAILHERDSGGSQGSLQFYTSGDGNSLSERLRITSAGDVGIGDNSPASRLTVTKTNASGDVGVRVKNNTATDGSAASPTTASLYLNTSTGTFNTLYIQARRYDNDTWFGYGDPTTAGHVPSLCITNDKRVGINTHVPKCSLQNSSPGLHIIGRGVDPTPHYDSYANLVVESIESRLQLCSTSGGSNASSIILSAAVSSSDNRHWVVEGSGADQSYQLHLGYMQTTSNTHFDSGLVSPQISVTTAGNVGINKQNPSDKLVVVGAITQENTSTSNTSSQLFFNNDTSNGAYRVRFDSNNATVGSIQVNPSNTVYNTTSDYRLKENITAISDGITRLKTLKPSRFNWKIDSSTTVDGFIAHEVTAVPEAVSGTKDEIATEDSKEAKKGDPIYQQIDHSKLVPLLTAALQEEISKRESLETRIAALEG